MTPAPHARTTAALFVTALVARLAWGLSVRAPPVWDAALYERAAEGIARGLGYTCYLFGPRADPTVPTAYYPVGYPAFLGALRAVFGASPGVVVASGALVGALSVALTHRLALRVGAPRGALVAALWFAMMPGQVMFSVVPMTEALWGVLLLGAVTALARPTRAVTLVAAGACLAAAVYVRPQAVVLAPLLPCVLAGTLRQRVERAAIVTATCLALVAPWTFRNARAMHGFALVSTNGASNLAVGSVPRATGIYLALTPDDGCRGVVGEVARERCWRAVAVTSIRRAPWRWLRLGWTKLVQTYDDEGFPTGYLRASRPDLAARPWWPWLERATGSSWRALFWIALLALWPLGARPRLSDAGRLCAATIAAVSLTHAVFFGGDRYHLPLAGLFAALAAGAWRAVTTPRVGRQRLDEDAVARGGIPVATSAQVVEKFVGAEGGP